MRRIAVTLLTLAVFACQAPTPTTQVPSGPAGDVAREVAAVIAPNAQLADRPLEDFLAALDLPKIFGANSSEVAGQIRKTRAAVAAARTAASVAAGPRLASLMASEGTFSIPHFANQLAHSLDELTRNNHEYAYPFRPFSSTESGREMFTTTTLNVTEIFRGERSKVTGTVRWSYSTITIETRSGATLLHITDDRELVGSIDVCPDAAGGVPSDLHTTANIAAQTGTLTTNRKSEGTSSFKGEVDDQASLKRVIQQSHVTASWQSGGGDGGFQSDSGATWNAGTNGYIGGLEVGSIQVSLTMSGTATAAEVAKAAGWDTALNAYALEPSYQRARELWRRGRCVVVAVSEYGAETPINELQQETPQHDEAVDPSSNTRFNVSQKHRFSGPVSAPITANLTGGQKTLTPNRLESGGSLTYKAPDEEDKKATVELKSTSKRGIGTLVLEFHTGGPGLTLTLSGTLKLMRTFLGTVEVTDTVSIGPVEFKKSFGDFWEGTGMWRAQTRSFVAVAGTTQTCTGSQSGTVTMLATFEERGGRKVWVVNPLDGSSDGTATSSCPGEINIEADAADQFLGAFDTFVIPEDGGTMAIHGSSGNASFGQVTGDGTLKAQTRH